MGRPSSNILSRGQVAARVLAGETLVIYNKKVIRVPQSWLDAHPGGALAILHFVGRDATDEVDAFHSQEALKRLNAFSIGSVEFGDQGWEPMLPPLASGWVRKDLNWHKEADTLGSEENSHFNSTSQVLLIKRDENSTQSVPDLSTLQPPPTTLSPKIQTQHSIAYRALHKRILAAGLYQCRYISGYGPEIARYLSFIAISVIAYLNGWFLTSALFLGFLWHQLVFTAHDLGHVGVTHIWNIDRLLGIFIANFMGGLSIGWWTENHNVHHLVTNHATHDPDIQHLPFFANTPEFLKSLYSSYYQRIFPFDAASRFFISVQHKLFYVVMSLARFNLYRLSYVYLAQAAFQPRRAKGGRWWWWLEITGLVVFFYWYGSVLAGIPTWGPRIGFLLISNIVPSPLHVQIVLSHYSRSTADLGPTESFVHRQLRTTVDVICPPSLAFLHGGLHLQVTHHLFPRLPRHNLLEASMLVKEFAKEQGLEYAEFGFVEGNMDVRNVLKSVADQVKIIGIVADSHVQEAMQKKVE